MSSPSARSRSAFSPASRRLIHAQAQVQPTGDPGPREGFLSNHLRHLPYHSLGPGNTVIVKQGPSLVGVLGRRAGSGLASITRKPSGESGLIWDAATLDRFLTNPTTAVPGTTMPMPVPDAGNRRNVIAYLSTLKIPAGVTLTNSVVPVAPPRRWRPTPATGDMPPRVSNTTSPWRICRRRSAPLRPGTAREVVNAAGGRRLVGSAGIHRAACLPPACRIRGCCAWRPTAIFSSRRPARIASACCARPTARRLPPKIRFSRTGLDRPFGIAFYPPGDDPQWIYVANNNSVVRFPYRNGDLKARGDAQVIVPRLS